MAWIKTVSYRESTGRLRRLYDRIKGPDDNVDNIMLAHSLRPHTMHGHMAIYKNVLHHSGNTVEKWFLETIGVWVSLLNQCEYCVEHHFSGLARLLEDHDRAHQIRSALESETTDANVFSPAQQEVLVYVRLLTESPATVTVESIARLLRAGLDDGQILEINQVAAYFAYANRTVLGLGVSLDGDIIGLSPGNSDDPDDWSHS